MLVGAWLAALQVSLDLDPVKRIRWGTGRRSRNETGPDGDQPCGMER